ncbi:MAG: sulfotransferase, partial [Actinomycetota bacterium]|nr:sulfotransferase [Actinomycetota bacterium]
RSCGLFAAKGEPARKMTESHPPFPFIVGEGRSGTTLLRAMLDAHPNVAIPPESLFMTDLGARGRLTMKRTGFDSGSFVSQLSSEPTFPRWELPTQEIAQDLAHRPAKDYPDAVRRIYALYARARGKPRYGDKSPMNCRQLPLIAALWPEARFVHLVRDGRDVAASYLDVAFGPSSFGEAAYTWKKSVSIADRDGEKLGALRYRVVRYEELVDEPHVVLADLCAFLDLEFDDRMLQYHEDATDVIASMSFPERHRKLEQPPTPGLRDWRKTMSDRDVAAFEVIAGATLERHGYERRHRRPAASVRARALWWWSEAQRHRVMWLFRRPLRALQTKWRRLVYR